MNRLLTAVIKMVRGIKNSIQRVEKWIIFMALKARVTEWPIVNAVINMSSCFQSLNWYLIHKAVMNKMWSSPFKSAICWRPNEKYRLKSLMKTCVVSGCLIPVLKASNLKKSFQPWQTNFPENFLHRYKILKKRQRDVDQQFTSNYRKWLLKCGEMFMNSLQHFYCFCVYSDHHFAILYY